MNAPRRRPLAEAVAERKTSAVPRAPDDNHQPPAFSDEAIALRFAERHASNLRFVAEWGRWFRYDGMRWRADGTLHAFDLARQICREVAAGCNQPKAAAAIASAKTVAAVEKLAKADRLIAATTDQWDCDPWVLNTPDGVVDLRSGQMRAHDPENYMTKIAATSPKGECPMFLAFLDRITGGDGDLIAYLRRLLGYSLTGITREHALFFAYGTGANGKSVLLSTVSGLLGDYHKTAPIETFVAGNVDRHPTDLAGLKGARLVTASETEEGRKWAEARIKQLTGGDTISARFMRQDFFDYLPIFKLVIAGNHKPNLRTVDEAIKRRFHLIPFAVTIPAVDRDSELTDKLKAEWPGILRWLVAGAIEWQASGLQPPPAVVSATAAYLEAEDAFAAWIDERCERDASAWSPSSALFASWTDYAVAAGEAAGSQKRFSQTLEARGFERHKKSTAQGFNGLWITPRDHEVSEWEARG